MGTPENTRRELSAFLRANLDEYACYCTLWFDEVYSHQIASRTSLFSDRFEYAKSFIRAISDGIASGKVISYQASVFVNVAEEPEFSEFANSIALAMTVIRRLAPLITRSCFGKPEKAREYRECLDEYLRGYVLAELEGFAQIASADR